MNELKNKLNELVEKKESLTRELERINYQIEQLEFKIKEEGEKIDKCQKFLSVAMWVFSNKEENYWTDKDENWEIKFVYFKNESFIYVFDKEEEYIYRIDTEDLEVVMYRPLSIDDIMDEYKEDAYDNRENRLRKDRIDDCEYNYCNDWLEDWLSGCDLDYYKDYALEDKDLLEFHNISEFQEVLEKTWVDFEEVVFEMDDSLSLKA